MKTIHIHETAVEAFRKDWPCHGLDRVGWIELAVADNGDVIDYECWREVDGAEEQVEIGFDGQMSIGALFDDAKANAIEFGTAQGMTEAWIYTHHIKSSVGVAGTYAWTKHGFLERIEP
jgi:hypothetical protein